MNVNQLSPAEKQIYWKSFFEQRAVIDAFRLEMIAINPEWGMVDSRALNKVVNQVFEGNFETDMATRAVDSFNAQQACFEDNQILEDEKLARELQEQFNFELTNN